MKATNSLTPAKKERQTFSVAIRGEALQNLIKASVSSSADAARLTGTLISAVASNAQLQQCNPASVVAAALRGEGMKLTYGQDYHLVPYGDKCTYIIGYKGLLHLLIATGEIADTNCIPVREGEYKGRNKKTKRPEFDFSVYDTAEEEDGHPILGWYFYVEMRNGYTASEYMRIGDILNHAARYSKTFDLETYMKLQHGEFTPKEAERICEKSPWYGNFDTMAAKTVIRKLLNSGFVPLANSAEIRRALDEDGESGEGDLISADILNGVNGDVIVVDENTGEVVDNANDEQEDASGAENGSVTEPKEQPRRASRQQQTPFQAAVTESAAETVASFFGDEE